MIKESVRQVKYAPLHGVDIYFEFHWNCNAVVPLAFEIELCALLIQICYLRYLAFLTTQYADVCSNLSVLS